MKIPTLRQALSLRAVTQPTTYEAPQLPAIPSSPVGFSFTPAGLLFHWSIGVAKGLKSSGLITPGTPLAGASAGALVATVLGCELDLDAALDAADALCADCRAAGTRGRLRSVLERVLDEVLPEDAHTRLLSRPGPVGIAITPLMPWPRGRVVTSFESKDDLMECLVGSCAVPFWFSGSLSVSCRGVPTVDGFFASPREAFGAPELPSAAVTVRACPFPSDLVGLRSALPEEADPANLLDLTARDLICPQLLGPDEEAQLDGLFNRALNPGEPAALRKLYEDGRRAAELWAERHSGSVVALGRARAAEAAAAAAMEAERLRSLERMDSDNGGG